MSTISRYRITVHDQDCTYLRNGVYDADVGERTTYFRNVETGSGTLENNSLIRRYLQTGRIEIQPVDPS